MALDTTPLWFPDAAAAEPTMGVTRSIGTAKSASPPVLAKTFVRLFTRPHVYAETAHTVPIRSGRRPRAAMLEVALELLELKRYPDRVRCRRREAVSSIEMPSWW